MDLAAGAALGAASSSSSSSVSLSELEEALEEELEEDEEEEGDDARGDFLDCLGASSISTSESLDSSELLLPLSLSLSPEELEEEDEEDFFALVPFVSPSHFWKSSSRDGAFFESVSELTIDLSVCSLANALLVPSKPCSDRKEATEAINCAGGAAALLLLLPLVCWFRESIVNTRLL